MVSFNLKRLFVARDQTISNLVKFIRGTINQPHGNMLDSSSFKAEDTETAVKTPASTPHKKAGEDAAGNTTPSKKSKTWTPYTGGETGTTPKKAAAILISHDNMSPEDKMMLYMRDVEGKSWAEIKSAWEAMTGTKVGGSTLCGRYGRIKANLVRFRECDEALILEAKKEIEERFKAEKWYKIAEVVEAKSGIKYPPAVIQKKFKELRNAWSWNHRQGRDRGC
ncbi:hypothetical protein VTN02DRAFT_6441 [Thermoascus thermophilus]